ncbi:MAG TPA: glycerol-3-phosphate ABC transporter ATP-binding protein [Thermotogae bacterium]|nr:glycerol-3-phosphate ABC transporter ATP-binding protein [Thermotogota bacterium]
MAQIRLENLWKIFKTKTEEVQAVRGINLTMPSGQLTVFLGPSGCGKTTTMRMIAGLEKPTSGKIYIDNEDVSNLKARERDIAFVFQSYALYPHMTVYQNVAFPLKAQKTPKDEIVKRVKWALELLGIWQYKDLYPSHLDSGTQQKVAIARAIVRRPKAFLLDEPLSNLDAKVREYTRAELRRLHIDLKVTTVYVTHDQVEAMSLADEIVIMKDGVIQQTGKPREVYENPANLFVANFIGSPGMNLFKARKEKDTIILGNLKIPVSHLRRYKEILPGYKESELILGIRPEYLKISSSNANGWKVEIEFIEPLGDEKIVDFSNGTLKGRLRTYRSTQVQEGEEVSIHIDIEKIRLFDEKSGCELLTMHDNEEVKA